MFEIMDTQTQEAVIKVIGIGGCGGNAVDHELGFEGDHVGPADARHRGHDMDPM